MSHVAPEPNSGCWLWTAATRADGYGQIGMQNPKRTELAHRMMWELRNGPIPTGILVLHKCDVRCCVNPDHLFLGTIADNNADRDSKGRTGWGERNRHARLTPEDVRGLRISYSLGASPSTIAADLGITPKAVWAIAHRKRWKHI